MKVKGWIVVDSKVFQKEFLFDNDVENWVIEKCVRDWADKEVKIGWSKVKEQKDE